MNQITVPNLGARPAHLSQADSLNLNDAASQNLSSGFAVVKFRGKQWSIRYRSEEIPVTMAVTGANGQQMEVARPDLPIVVVGMSPHMSKAWYEEAYQTGTTGKFPDCFSVQGIEPDAASPKKQFPTCAPCPHNQFGTRITGNNRKGKACMDHRRLAIVPAEDMENAEFGGPMLLQVPPMSLRNLDSYCKTLKRLGTDISQVITKISFEGASEFPELVFEPVGWVQDPADWERVKELNATSDVRRMLFEEAVAAEGDAGTMLEHAQAVLANRPQHLQPEAAAQATQQQVTQPQVTQPQAAPTQPPPPNPQPAPAPAQTAPTPTTAPKRSPFGKAAKPTPAASQATTTVVNPTPPAQGQPAPAQQVIQGAPADMETAIDELLQ